MEEDLRFQPANGTVLQGDALQLQMQTVIDNIQAALHPPGSSSPAAVSSAAKPAWTSVVSGSQLTAKGKALHFVSPAQKAEPAWPN